MVAGRQDRVLPNCPPLCGPWNSRLGAPFLNMIKAGLGDREWIREPKEWAALSGMSGLYIRSVSDSPSRRPCQEHPSLSASHLCGGPSYCGGTPDLSSALLHLLQMFPICHLVYQMQQHLRLAAVSSHLCPWSLWRHCHPLEMMRIRAQ